MMRILKGNLYTFSKMIRRNQNNDLSNRNPVNLPRDAFAPHSAYFIVNF